MRGHASRIASRACFRLEGVKVQQAGGWRQSCSKYLCARPAARRRLLLSDRRQTNKNWGRTPCQRTKEEKVRRRYTRTGKTVRPLPRWRAWPRVGRRDSVGMRCGHSPRTSACHTSRCAFAGVTTNRVTRRDSVTLQGVGGRKQIINQTMTRAVCDPHTCSLMSQLPGRTRSQPRSPHTDSGC